MKLLKSISFHFNTLLNNINWNRAKKKAIKLKKKHKKDFFVVPKSKTSLMVISGIYPFNKLFLKSGHKRLKYKDLIKQSYFNTLNVQL